MAGGLMVALVGEQPIPNVLAIRYEQPETVLLVETETTAAVGRRLAALFPDAEHVTVPPYDMAAIRIGMRAKIAGRGNATYNLTGGTKPMAMAGYGLAQEEARPVTYIQSEGGTNVFYRYQFDDGQPVLVAKEALPTLLTIDDYLRAQYGVYTHAAPGQWFEKLVSDTLMAAGQIDELMTCVKVGPAMEVDLVLRKGNYIGFAELKSGADETHKSGVDQVSGDADRVTSGTYTRRMLINDRQLDHNVLTVAQARGVRVVTLKSAEPGKPLAVADRDKLVNETLRFLGRFGDRR